MGKHVLRDIFYGIELQSRDTHALLMAISSFLVEHFHFQFRALDESGEIQAIQNTLHGAKPQLCSL